MEITEVFGKNLRDIRKAQSMSAELLGEKAGVSGKHIYDIEKNIKKPSFDLVVSIADALKVKIGDLFESDEAAPVLTMPVSKTLQKLLAVPDEVYDAVEGVSKGNDVWKAIAIMLRTEAENERMNKGQSKDA